MFTLTLNLSNRKDVLLLTFYNMNSDNVEFNRYNMYDTKKMKNIKHKFSGCLTITN